MRMICVASLAVFAMLGGRASNLCAQAGNAPQQPTWSPSVASVDASFRGISIAAHNEQFVWASGNKSTYILSADSGKTWKLGTFSAADLDFRAVHVINADVAYLMVAAQDIAFIYRTTTGGKKWEPVYADLQKGAFLDALAFFDSTRALALGDPINGRFVIVKTDDGKTWERLPVSAQMPAALPGEAAFAASNTAMVTVGKRHAWFATGGGQSARVFRSDDGGKSWQVTETPVAAGKPTRGIFTLAFRDTLNGIALGGDYEHPDSTVVTGAITEDGGKTWTAIAPSAAIAYISGVSYVRGSHGKTYIGVGTRGTAQSDDGGKTWRQLDQESLNAIKCTAVRCWGVGDKGAVRSRPVGTTAQPPNEKGQPAGE